MQEEAAEKIDAGLRKALAGWRLPASSRSRRTRR